MLSLGVLPSWEATFCELPPATLPPNSQPRSIMQLMLLLLLMMMMIMTIDALFARLSDRLGAAVAKVQSVAKSLESDQWMFEAPRHSY